MTKDVEFYFDFGSPYSYLAYHQLKKITEKYQAKIVYRPVLLGGIFQATNNQSPAMIPAKARYAFKDFKDWSKYLNIPFKFNPSFPINSFFLMRGAVGYQEKSPEHFEHYLATVFKAMFQQPQNLNDPQVVQQVLEDAGLSWQTYQNLIEDHDIKQKAKDLTSQAVERGLFGVPAFFVDGEMFWGQDRLHFVEERLIR